VLGVNITDLTLVEAIDLLHERIRVRSNSRRAWRVYFANANTLNCACDDPDFRDVLNSADHVFGDGTGVRWAARARGVHLRGNVNGTDLVPALFAAFAGRGYRFFLLGSTPELIGRASLRAEALFPGWTLAGAHHGYLSEQETADLVRHINEARPDVLLVGMGHPVQERWIKEHAHELDVPVCMAVGGLFEYWGGHLARAPLWMRKLGMEWVHIMLQQPHKMRRYLMGNPRFLARVAMDTLHQWRAKLERWLP
jgi:N-acetylglucosaminyldiphosphoundecaprenol N-acetyl-beta-D-mannosaminyltransferase